MPPKKNTSKCVVNNCERIYHANGICRIHYNRLRKTGRLNVLPKDPEEKLRAYSTSNQKNGCWEWKNTNTQGYGVICLGYKTYQAHRVSWQTFNKQEIPKDKQINHKCHNRRCINPDHLYLGTHADNMRDMILANRSKKGSESKSAKLNENQVIEIKNLLNIGKRSCDIANQFNISRSAIWGIKYKRNWGHIK